MFDTDKQEEYPEFRWRALSGRRQQEIGIFLGREFKLEVINGSAPLDVVIKMAREAIDEARDRLIEDGPVEWNKWADGQMILLRQEQKASLLQSPERYRARLNVAACEWVSANRASKPVRDVSLPGMEKLSRSLLIMRDDPKAELRYKVLRLATELTEEKNHPERWKYRAERASDKGAYQIPMPLRKEIKRQLGVAYSTSRDMLMDMGFQYPPDLLITAGMI